MTETSLQLEQAAFVEDSDDEQAGDEQGEKEDSQMNGVMVLTLLDKIIGAVDQIQQTQNSLEQRQQEMESAVTGIQSELTKLSKSHTTTSNTVNKMLEKVRKVSVNVKTVRQNLEKQAGQIKRLESNEAELLKRRNFKVMIYQDEVKVPSKVSVSKVLKGLEKVQEEGEQELQEQGETEGKEEDEHIHLSSDEEVEIEEIIEESRAERIKKSSMRRVDDIKKAFSKEKMEKTRQRTRENLEKTKQRTKENLEKTKHNIEKKMNKLGTRIVNTERKEKMKTSRDKFKKSFTPDHVVYARSKTAVYKVPPFTFHVKKIREGEDEPKSMEMVNVVGEEEELIEDNPEMEILLDTAEDEGFSTEKRDPDSD
ncbi:caveolae-associated protein 1 [Erpetoichthys calabaricus]|nr:caveolae-associated protein 1 [Erpetoichthys calabaricus]